MTTNSSSRSCVAGWLHTRVHLHRITGAPAAASADIVTPEERGVLHTVGAAGLVAFVDVYDSLESACK
jgi:hypothetical protein